MHGCLPGGGLWATAEAMAHDTEAQARAAVQLAAADYGIAQRKMRELIMFWFDRETVSPSAPVEVLA